MVICGLVGAVPFTGGPSFPVWFALAPVFYLSAAAPNKRQSTILGVLFAHFWLFRIFWFIFPHTAVGMVVLTLYTSIFYVFALMVIRVFARKSIVAGIFGGSAIWVLVEMARARMPIVGFPWNLIGHAAWHETFLLQAADLFGVYGLSFLLVGVNACLAFVVPAIVSQRCCAPPGSVRLRNLSAAVMLAMLLGGYIYGHIRIAALKPTLIEGPNVAMIQGCEYQKVERTNEEEQAQLTSHLKLHEKAASEAPDGEEPALICWAETMVPGRFNDSSFGEEFRETVKRVGIPVLCGSDWVYEDDKEIESEFEQRWNNSAFILDGSGAILTRYSKRRLVPFGEYVPLKNVLPFMKALESVYGIRTPSLQAPDP